MPEQDTPAEDVTPLLRIVKGNPTPEEVAALVAVVSALSTAAGASAGPQRPRPQWSAPARRLRGQHHHAAGAWRASGLPR